MSAMTSEQLALARHALGLPNQHKKSYRNRYYIHESHEDCAHWNVMVEEGFAAKHLLKTDIAGRWDILYTMTFKGAQLSCKPGECLDPEDFPSN